MDEQKSKLQNLVNASLGKVGSSSSDQVAATTPGMSAADVGTLIEPSQEVSFVRQGANDTYCGLVGGALKVEVVKNDITGEQTDAITNTRATTAGGGVSGRIKHVGGPALDSEL